MTKDQVIEAISIYESKLVTLGFEEKRFTTNGVLPTSRQVGSHALWMCRQVQAAIADEKLEKAMRWLGWVQASVWLLGLFSIDNLKDHNR